MAAATYPAEPDATKALDYQSVIALAQPDRVDGDPVSGHGGSVAAEASHLQGTPRGPEFWTHILASDADMYARGAWSWEEYERMRDTHLRWEQEDWERLTVPLPPQ